MFGLFNPVTMAVAAASICGLVWGHGYMQGRDGKGAAVAIERARCDARISGAQKAAEQTIADIVRSVDDGAQASDVTQYCKRNPGLCRSENRQ